MAGGLLDDYDASSRKVPLLLYTCCQYASQQGTHTQRERQGRCETKTFSKKICAEQQNRNVLEVFHHSESRAEFDAIAMEQANIQKNEVRCAIMKEFQGRQ